VKRDSNVRVAGICVALAAYGLLASGCGGGQPKAASPKVRTSWAVPTPAGYVALSSKEARAASGTPTGVQTLKDVATSGSEHGNSTALRHAGWRSGISEYWYPKSVSQVDSSNAQVDSPYALTLSIDQFDSPSEAAAYEEKSMSYFSKGPKGVSAQVVPLKYGVVPGAMADKIELPRTASSKTTITLVFLVYHVGPYMVTVGGGETNTTGHLQSLAERLATAQVNRLP